MKLKYVKALVAVIVALGVLLPSTISHAKSFSGRSSSSYSSRSSSSSYSGSYKSSPKSSYSSGSSSSSKKSKSDDSSSISLKKKPSEKASSSSAKKSSGTFSGATSKVSGKTYSGKTTKAYVGGRYVSVNHYYHAGFAPSGWFGYYSGFTMGMFMISMMHPWGYTYHPVGGPGYVSYGASPIAWIVDIIALILIFIIVIALIRAFKAPKTYRRRF
ncbi:hypothetical protein SC22_01645 [Bacillus sp. A053]|uniref:hypothetical protein n=1 Tax=Bacillus TaxID=1386 RepID=UPI00058A1A32|nr:MULTISPECIES: hypothetical protein [unclassified Bacillus (in: firmicutes)]ASB63049.1 hypothetical protein CDO84_19545 [Bacillus sp. MD-5]KIH40741.1 hypothetical protein SC22_01645 [Bacillus sp. A053]TII17301.1 hypothetical protein C6Y43_04820 [Bacillus subtilis]BEV39523.1 hypothetical protein BSB_25960 [Bacillus stercoris]